MGLLALNRLMSMRRDRRRRRIYGRNGFLTSVAKRKDSPCRQDDDYRSDKYFRYSGPSLPEDIWDHIHSLLPLRDAARVACVSHSFRRSWGCYPNLTITREALGLRGGEDEMSYDISSEPARKTDHILQNHSGIGMTALKLEIYDFPIFSTSFDLDRWLGIAVRSVTLEKLRLTFCRELIFLKIPRLLQRLSHLTVDECINLEVIESKAPNLYSFGYTGSLVRLSLGDSLRKFEIYASYWEFVGYACENLPRMLPNLEALEISSRYVRDALVIPEKFLHLQLLCIGFFSPDYDYFSLVSLLDACPSLDTFVLYVSDVHLAEEWWECISSPSYMSCLFTVVIDIDIYLMQVKPDRVEQESVVGDSTHDLRQISGHLHRNIKDVQIVGFCSARSIVELTCHILENAKSLECLTLSTNYNCEMECPYGMRRDMTVEAHKTVLAIERYIVGKVPSMVELSVVEPCSRCNALET